MSDTLPMQCACGCGGAVAPAKRNRPQARFICGHQARANSQARGKARPQQTRCGRVRKAESYLELRRALKRHEAAQKADGQVLEPVSYCCVRGRE